MKKPDSAPPNTAVSRLKQRWLGSPPNDTQSPKANVPAEMPERRIGFPARVAEFLLVFRMRARRSVRSSALLERAVQVVLVTCKNWFGATDRSPRDSDRR